MQNRDKDMKKDDMPQFALRFAKLSEIYAKNISEFLIENYWEALQDFELEDVEEALSVHTNNPDCGQYFPKPADVVRFIEGSGETKALKAWTMVEKAIHQVGSYESVAFEDPLIHAVLEDMGGWVKLCSTTLEALPFRANEFQKRYMGFLIKKPERHPKYLAGLAEIDNAKNGFEIKPPLLVGDAKKAEQVMLTGGGRPLAIQTFSQAIMDVMKQLPIQTKNEDDV